MTRATLERLQAQGYVFDDEIIAMANRVQTQLDIVAEKNAKKLAIKFVKCESDKTDFLITFQISTNNLSSQTAKVFVEELDELFNDDAVKNQFTINKNGTSAVILKITKSKNFTEILFDDGNEFQATVNADGLSAVSPKFTLLPLLITNKEKCFCNRGITELELKNIIIELRKNTFDGKESIYYYHQDKIFHRNDLTKNEYKKEIIKETDRTFEKLAFVLNKLFTDYKINNCIQKISFLAQMYIETAFYTSTIELTHLKKAYEPYRGRGFIQLTGTNNKMPGIQDSRTKNATAYLGYKLFSKVDVVADPSIISTSLHYSADSAGWFWVYGKLKEDGSLINLNTIYGDKESQFKELTRLIKGSSSEFKERYDAFTALLKIMKYEKCTSK